MSLLLVSNRLYSFGPRACVLCHMKGWIESWSTRSADGSEREVCGGSQASQAFVRHRFRCECGRLGSRRAAAG
jgi:hypothetical protein